MKDQGYWFPAKSYGWGWGFSITWQGWLVLAVYIALMIGGIPFIRPEVNPGLYGLYVTVLSGALLVVCRLKGEPPSWRWGK